MQILEELLKISLEGISGGISGDIYDGTTGAFSKLIAWRFFSGISKEISQGIAEETLGMISEEITVWFKSKFERI